MSLSEWILNELFFLMTSSEYSWKLCFLLRTMFSIFTSGKEEEEEEWSSWAGNHLVPTHSSRWSCWAIIHRQHHVLGQYFPEIIMLGNHPRATSYLMVSPSPVLCSAPDRSTSISRPPAEASPHPKRSSKREQHLKSIFFFNCKTGDLGQKSSNFLAFSTCFVSFLLTVMLI